MHNPPSCPGAANGGNSWNRKAEHLHRRQTPGPDGEPLVALELIESRLALVAEPVPQWRVGADLAIRVAFEALALKIVFRDRVAACLRPLLAGESGNLRHGEVLRCDDRSFPQQRDAALLRVLEGGPSRALLQVDHALLACIAPLVSPDAQAPRMAVATAHERPRLSPDGRAARDRAEVEEHSVARDGAPSTEVPLTHEQARRVELHLDLVRQIARWMVSTVGQRVLALDEFESAGYEALVQAAARYDPTRTASFRTFAHYRVRGAMVDALRKRAPGRRARDLRRRAAGKATSPLRMPDLGIHSYERFASSAPNPERILVAADERRQLRTLVEGLGPQERDLIEAVYVQNRTMKDFADELGVSGATISRRHAKIVRRLRRQILIDEVSRPHTGSMAALPKIGHGQRRTPGT